MTKRIIALLLALILTVGLLPTVALAADPTAPTDETPGEDAVSFTKDVVTKNGQDMIKIEAYVNGDVKTQVTATPCDIVLVLDQSGSMAYTVDKTEYTYTEVNCTEWSYNKVREYSKNTTLYYKPCWRCGDAHRVSYWKNDNWFSKDTYQIGYQCGGYWYALRDNGKDDKNTSRDYVFYTGKLYTRTTKTTSTNKYQALKAAASAFLNTVSTNAKQNKVDHRVAIVGFGSAGDDYYRNTEILTLKQSGEVGKNYYWLQADDYKNALVPCNTASGGINPTLTNAVNALDANGATAVDLGLEMANNIFKNQTTGTYTGENARAKIVVVVTDGNPTHSNGFENGVATTAIQQAKAMKDANTKVFTIGIALDGNNAKNFISYVSSDYPNATSWNYPGQPIDAAPKYTSYVSDAEAMKDIFSDIASEATSVSASAKLTQTAVLTDTISQYFKLPEGATKDSIEVYTSAAKFEDGAFTWDTEEELTNADVEIEGQKIEVAGFDYTANCVTKTAKDKAGTDFGKKLVIYIPIEKDTSKAQFGGYLPTNDDATLNDANGDNGDKGYKADGAHKDCTVVAPRLAGKTIEIYAGKSATTTDLFKGITPNGTEWPDGNNNAGVDLKYTIKDEQENTIATAEVPAGTSTVTWTFVKGKTDAKQYAEAGEYKFTIDCEATCKNKTTHEGSTANSVQATGTIKVKRTTATVTLTKEITGALSDTEKQSVLSSLKVYVKSGETARTEFVKGNDGKYSATLTAGAYTIEEEGHTVEGYDCTATLGEGLSFTVVAGVNQNITLTNNYTAKQYTISYEYTGTVPQGAPNAPASSNAAYKSGQTVAEVPTLPGYTFVGWTSDQVTPDANGEFTMPAENVVFKGHWVEKDKFTISYEVVGPTGCGSVDPVSETKHVDATSVDGSTAAAESGYRFVGWYDNPGCTGTALSTDAQYIPSKPEAGWADKTYYAKFESLTYTITFTTEAGGTLTGTTEHTGLAYNADFPTEPGKVANPGYYFDGWYKDGTKVTSFPKKVTENATYTAKWLSYDSIDLDLTGKIQKTLNSDVELSNQSFTINVKQTVAEVASATVSATTVSSGTGYTGSAPFQKDDFKLIFAAPDTYIYSIVEEQPVRSGMTYDVNKYTATGHTMTVVVEEDAAHALSVTSVTVDGTPIDLEDNNATWLTITNNYVEPKETFDLNTLITKNFEVADNSKPIPTGTYEFRAQIVETDSTWQVLENGATYEGTATLTAGGTTYFDFGRNQYLQLAAGDHYYLVSEISDTVSGTAGTITYDKLTYSLKIKVDADGKVENVEVRNHVVVSSFAAENAVEFGEKDHITFTNTYFEEKDPNKCTIDFSKFVKKELTATGSKTVDEATFIVDVAGSYDGEATANALTPTEAQATTDEDILNTTLTATIRNIVGGNVYEEPFTGSVTVSKPGHYTFTLTEREGTQSGVTYDESTYQVSVNIERIGDNLVIRDATTYLNNEQIVLIKLENDVPVTAGYIVFKNTIDTGKDDYYPIIIPTIIGKDTGMLNKTDHFAYVIGYPDGTVHPNGQITRAEVATIFFRLLRDEVRDGAFTTSNSYSDVAYGKWYNNPISTMSALGIITGYPDGTFKPDKPITRAEFAAIAARFDETQSGKSATFSDVIGHWAAKEIGIAYYNDWIKGYPDGTFKPDQNITRAEAMTLINRVLERKPESPADLLTDMNTWTDNLDTSKWYYLDVQEATNSHGYTRKTFNYELWRQMLNDPDWSRYER